MYKLYVPTKQSMFFWSLFVNSYLKTLHPSPALLYVDYMLYVFNNFSGKNGNAMHSLKWHSPLQLHKSMNRASCMIILI